MQALSSWFPVIGQLSPSMKAFISIVGVTLVVGAVVFYVVSHSRKNTPES
ncbi:hypothetical protein [Pseudomonas sp. dw_358]|nr:hypothetical protein [Pseudomonas sp. dw_358]